MRALVVDRPGSARVEEVELPSPGVGEVLVRVDVAGICGSDLELLERRRPAPFVRYPIIPGHEWAGGATESCDALREDPVEALGERFGLVFEAASGPGGAGTAIRLARRGGTVVLEGISGAAGPTVGADLLVLRHLRTHGIFGASRPAWRWVVELFSSGALDPRPLVTHRFALDRHEAAFALLRDRSAGAVKVELVPNGAP